MTEKRLVDHFALERILDFATADLSDPKQIERLNPPSVQLPSLKLGYGFTVISPWPEEALDEHATSDQQALRELLDKFISRKNKTVDLRTELRANLKYAYRNAGDVTLRGWDPKAAGDWFIQHRTPTILNWGSHGLLSLLDTGLRSHLRRCALLDCQNYFIDWPDTPGQKQKYCSAKHSSTNRQRRYRQNRKKDGQLLRRWKR